MYFILFYDYVENVVARRAPYRDPHLALANEWISSGKLVMGGAFDEPVDGAALVFRASSAAEVEEFVARDPYVRNGVVVSWRIRPWTVVVGRPDLLR